MTAEAVSGDDPFADVLVANAEHAKSFAQLAAAGVAAKGLALLTCMDSRIDPLSMLGLRPGDAKILRNAGARVTADVLRTLVLASYLLGVKRVMVVAHTGCRMAGGTEEDVHRAIAAAGGPDTTSLSFLTTTDQEASLRGDVRRIQAWPYLTDLAVGGFIYDLSTGSLRRVV
jgi:carbonic anhydrase